jgi:ATP-dependent RNA helicase RhlE
LTFRDFHLLPPVIEGLDAMGFQYPTPIQQQAIPAILAGKDVIACAQTGTGKTAAYLLPVINKIIQFPDEYIKALIIVPTRELAIQVDEAVQGFAYFTRAGSIAIYGGTDGMAFSQEKRALSEGVDIVIATPGRLISHLNQKYADLQRLHFLVLDEADHMLDMGFSDDIHRIISYLPRQRQTLLFSATMPPKIRDLAKKILRHPEHINIAVSKPAEGIIQGAYLVYNAQKNALLKSLLIQNKISSILIFASSKNKVRELTRELKKMHFNVAAIHSDLSQDDRNEVMQQFKSRKIQILVATDIVSRGIDIDGIELVINYDVPQDAEDYIHRVGRTARAESTGVALTFVNPDDQPKLKKIEQLIGSEIRKIPLPVSLGKAPEYQPDVKKRKSAKKRGNRRRR